MLPMKIIQRLTDLVITLLLWSYFLFGSVAFFFLFYIPAYLFSKDRVRTFQKLSYLHMKIFFALVRLLVPRTKFVIREEVRAIRSSVIVCNHISYLDPILLISLLPRQCTIVKSTFFTVPFFGWLLRNSGYIPSTPSEMTGPAMIRNLENIKKHLASGGNLFVFPEGTRSRNGKLTEFNKGVFSIARYCAAPLQLVLLQGTNDLFRPGSFLFGTRNFSRIEVKIIRCLKPDYASENFSAAVLADQSRAFFEDAVSRDADR